MRKTWRTITQVSDLKQTARCIGQMRGPHKIPLMQHHHQSKELTVILFPELDACLSVVSLPFLFSFLFFRHWRSKRQTFEGESILRLTHAPAFFATHAPAFVVLLIHPRGLGNWGD